MSNKKKRKCMKNKSNNKETTGLKQTEISKNIDEKEKKNEIVKTEETEETQENEGYQLMDFKINEKEYHYKIPPPFFITNEGKIYYEDSDKVIRLSHLLVVPLNIIQNVDTDEEKIEIALRKDGKWKTGIFYKQQVYSNIMELANFGVPVNTNNSKMFIRYFADLEAENDENIPKIKSVSKLGWRDKYFVPFSKNCPFVIDMDYRLSKWIKAYTEKGTLREWREEINPYRQNNLFRFILASSFASVLLKPLGHRIFMVFNWGNSRAGKSAALYAALSVWGNPYDLVTTFNTTAVGIERLAGYYNDVPLGLDEKQVNKSQTELEKLVYMLSSGISKIRGNKTGGVQQINTWNTIILATGEETISNNNTTTGVQTRCLEIEGSPFDYDEKSASNIYEIVSNYYGTAGRKFIEAVTEKYSKDDYYILRRELKEIQEKLEKATNNDIRSYLTAVSLVVLADMIVEEDVMGQRADETSIKMGIEILNNLESQRDIDIVDKCYEYIKSWILSNHKSFDKYKEYFAFEDPKLETEEDVVEKTSTSKSFGIYQNNVYYVHRAILEDKLKASGYSYNKIVREFAKRGYITPKTDEQGNILENTIQKKFRGKNARMFAFPMQPVEKELEEDEKRERMEEFLSRVSTGMSVEKRAEMYGEIDRQLKEAEEESKKSTNNSRELTEEEKIANKMIEDFKKSN
jgi:zinc finger CHC2-family protein